MEKFLSELRKALEEANVEKKDEIIAEYLEHFSVGHEAGMTDEEIIERLDSVEDIVRNASNKKQTSTKIDVVLDLEYFSDFEIIQKDKISGIEFDIEESAFDYITIEREDGKIHLKNKSSKNIFKKNKNFEGTMFIGKDVQFGEFCINNPNCDIRCDASFDCSSFTLSNVSGDVGKLHIVAEESIQINNVSGDLKLSWIKAPTLKINNVSGDIKIEELTTDVLKINTVSGDIIIHHGTTATGNILFHDDKDASDCHVSTVSGKIEINGETVVKSIKDIFKTSWKW